ncbi:uncharacterized protein LOC107432083 [Ziziphus jujuba]|uniref:holo-[acyl-carrier-protein] synthase n=1 Tax=Ziziphus jujuba TaxID=326968 RepID=A0A6P4BHQ6_ZIZJJ|nr:uncharacterized protein LOC107432083 [Ziziphus jujuba]
MFLIRQRPYLTMNIHCLQRCFCSAPSPLAALQLPSPMEAHLWYVLPEEVRSEKLMAQYTELLSPCERENVLSMRGEQLKKSAVLSRALVRTTIARYTNFQVDPKSLKFRKNRYGKPQVDWENADGRHPPPLHFNISHTSSLIACGVTVDSPIGIDVEEKNRKLKNHVLAFARRYFSSQELEHLTAISDPEIQRQELVKLWTIKEAYVKALGRGFSAAPFKTFTIRFKAKTRGSHLSMDKDTEASEIIVESFDDPGNITSNWQFALVELAGSHYAAICTEKAKIIEGRSSSVPMKLTVRRTIPFVEDECLPEIQL